MRSTPQRCAQPPASCSPAAVGCLLRLRSIQTYSANIPTRTRITLTRYQFAGPPGTSAAAMNAPTTTSRCHKPMLCSPTRQALQHVSREITMPPTPSRVNQPLTTRAVSGLSFHAQTPISQLELTNPPKEKASNSSPSTSRLQRAMAGMLISSASGAPESTIRLCNKTMGTRTRIFVPWSW